MNFTICRINSFVELELGSLPGHMYTCPGSKPRGDGQKKFTCIHVHMGMYTWACTHVYMPRI
ncbi:nudix hydrolase 26, chloroplastic-like isoform X1 [Iris pallida]|uniref:Nudix hydrolase 26, chloroplastic-like isoform X1 n=1 Tax=Iris pallida TaxID=29817 RepID=A0AAX6DW84_IRIPA|nr:nudix hydrolase 26, chloroplastic-like isoform X1 [Iris pallida]KAJ6806930.1 nudix hydrolase 26, chloroplastic-like isoform X1 [Iris pallida]